MEGTREAFSSAVGEQILGPQPTNATASASVAGETATAQPSLLSTSVPPEEDLDSLLLHDPRNEDEFPITDLEIPSMETRQAYSGWEIQRKFAHHTHFILGCSFVDPLGFNEEFKHRLAEYCRREYDADPSYQFRSADTRSILKAVRHKGEPIMFWRPTGERAEDGRGKNQSTRRIFISPENWKDAMFEYLHQHRVDFPEYVAPVFRTAFETEKRRRAKMSDDRGPLSHAYSSQKAKKQKGMAPEEQWDVGNQEVQHGGPSHMLSTLVVENQATTTVLSQPHLTLADSSDSVICVAFSPDGQYMATGSMDHTIWVRHAVSIQQNLKTDDDAGSKMENMAPLICIDDHERGVVSLAWAPHRPTRLASASEDETVKVWDILPNNAHQEVRIVTILQGHHSEVQSVEWAPNGSMLASSSKDGSVRIWDTKNWGCVKVLGTNQPPDQPLVETGLFRLLKLVGMANPSSNLTAAPKLIPPYEVFISHSGEERDKILARQMYDSLQRRGGLQTYLDIRGDPEHHDAALRRANLGIFLLSSNFVVHDKSLKEMQAFLNRRPDEDDQSQFDPLLVPVYLDFSPDDCALRADQFFAKIGRLDLVRGSDQKIQTINAFRKVSKFKGVHVTNGYRGAIQDLLKTLSSRYSFDDDSSSIIGWCKSKLVRQCKVHFSPDGRYIACNLEYGSIAICNTGDWREVVTLGVFGSSISTSVQCLRWMSDSRRLVSGYSDSIVRVWLVEERRCLVELKGHADAVTSVAVSPSEVVLASASRDRDIKVWSIDSRTCLVTLSAHSEAVRDLAWSPNENWLSSVSEDGTMKVWDLRELVTAELRVASRKATLDTTSSTKFHSNEKHTSDEMIQASEQQPIVLEKGMLVSKALMDNSQFHTPELSVTRNSLSHPPKWRSWWAQLRHTYWSRPKEVLYISHAGEQKQTVAIPLYLRLYQYGVAPVPNAISSLPGRDCSIDDALGKAAIVVFIVSPEFVFKSDTMRELKIALQRHDNEPKKYDRQIVIPVFFNLAAGDLRMESSNFYEKFHNKLNPELQAAFSARIQNGETTMEQILQLLRRATELPWIEGTDDVSESLICKIRGIIDRNSDKYQKRHGTIQSPLILVLAAIIFAAHKLVTS